MKALPRPSEWLTWRAVVSLFVLLLLCVGAYASPWVHVYGGAGQDWAAAAEQTLDGGFIVVGRYGSGTLGPWVMKLDQHGRIEWQHSYGGLSYSKATSILVLEDGGFLVGGTLSNEPTGRDFWLLRLVSTGETLWERVYGGPEVEIVLCLEQLSDGNFLAAGQSRTRGGQFAVLKVGRTGELLWQFEYSTASGGGYDGVQDIIETSDGGYLAVGHTQESEGVDYDFLVVKLDSDGAMEWRQAYDSGFRDDAYSVLEMPDGGFLVVGKMWGISDCWALMLDRAGSIRWESIYHTGGGALDAELTSRGTMLVAGHGGYPYRCWIMELDADGAVEWFRRYYGPGNDTCRCVGSIAGNGYIAVGATDSFGFGSQSALVMKLDRSGDVLGSCFGTGFLVEEVPLGVSPTSATVFSLPLGGTATSYSSRTPSVSGTEADGQLLVVCGGQEPETLCDLDGDGLETVADVRLLQQAVTGCVLLPQALESVADIDGDGELTPTDVGLLAARIIGR